MRSLEPLFEPFKTGQITLPNRFVMAPMSRYFAPDGVPEAGVPAYYRRRAEGGVGLIITEGVAPPHPAAQYKRSAPVFRGTSALAVWAEVVRQVHAVGTRIFLQLWHTGLSRVPSDTANPDEPSIGPSGIFPGRPDAGRAMTQRDIDDVIACYGAAAETAQRLGFDGVNIHAAHGYIIDEFFWSVTNLRTDRYGGDIAARSRFGAEIVAEVRRRVGPGFPIMLRFSQWKTPDYEAKLAHSPAELEALLAPLVTAGVDIFDVSTRRFWLPEFTGSELGLAGWTRKLTAKPTMTVGCVGLESPRMKWAPGGDRGSEVSIDSLDRLESMFARGDFDLVAIGRALLSNPSLPQIIRDGQFDRLRPYRPESLAVLETSAHPSAAT